MFNRKVPRWIGWPLLGLWVFFVLSYLARQSTFHPMPYPEGQWGLRESLGAQDVWLQTSDEVQIHGWHVRVEGKPEWVTLYLHGNAGNITHRADHLVAIRGAGSEVFIIDYRGYGKSDGSPTEAGMYRDADAAYQYLLEGYEANRIVVHGESLGTAAAVDPRLAKGVRRRRAGGALSLRPGRGSNGTARDRPVVGFGARYRAQDQTGQHACLDHPW